MQATQGPIAEKNKVPLLFVSSYLYSIHEKGYRYNFSPFPKSPDCAKAVFDILDSIPAAQKPKKVAIFMEKAPVGMELGDMWTKESVKRGYGQPLYKEQAADMKDFSSLIMEAKSAGAEILLTGPTTPQGITLTKQSGAPLHSKILFCLPGARPHGLDAGVGKRRRLRCLGSRLDLRTQIPGRR